MRRVDQSARYEKDLNLWVRQDQKSYYLGVTDWAQAYVGDIWSIIFESDHGASITNGQHIVTLESDKSTTELLSPVGGVISKLNERLISEPGLINTDCYGAGWLLELSQVDADKYITLNDAVWYEDAVNAFFRKGD